MTSHTLDSIREIQQRKYQQPDDAVPAPHEPDLLLIGCVDARLNLRTDLHIPEGKAIIYRNIAALVAGANDGLDRHVSEAAILEFAIEVMKVQDIVVAGHTDCGGIKACLGHIPGTDSIHSYLAPLEIVRDEVIATGGNVFAQSRAMEQAAVRMSVANLMTYDVVLHAVKQKRLQLHGWVVNTATLQIFEMDTSTGIFAPMR